MNCLSGVAQSIVQLIGHVGYGEQRLSITHEMYLHFPTDDPGDRLVGIVPGLVIIHLSNKWKKVFRQTLAQELPGW